MFLNDLLHGLALWSCFCNVLIGCGSRVVEQLCSWSFWSIGCGSHVVEQLCSWSFWSIVGSTYNACFCLSVLPLNWFVYCLIPWSGRLDSTQAWTQHILPKMAIIHKWWLRAKLFSRNSLLCVVNTEAGRGQSGIEDSEQQSLQLYTIPSLSKKMNKI